MKVNLREKSVYGNILIYPDCDISRKICELIKTKTLSKSNIKVIESMGYKIEIREV